MAAALFSTTGPLMDHLALVRKAAPVLLLTLFWCWETWRPFFGHREGRWTHAVRNVAVAAVNTAAVGLVFCTVLVTVAEWTAQNEVGLLHLLGLAWPVSLVLAFVLLDGWMYVWHRANHALPLLWRFHRMHHSDRHMDVTTATRFHLGEHVGSAAARLALIPLLGVEVWHLVVYDTVAVAVTQFHHADISLGRWDRWLRLFLVTPHMHKVHHSDWRPETNSNYSTVLSVWDRLAGSFRMRPDPKSIVFGLTEFTDPAWQTFVGMLKTPVVSKRMAPTSSERCATTSARR